MNRRPAAAGFTLIEMLVAITLMGLMGVVCWRGLAYVVSQRQTIEDDSAQIAQLVRTFAQVERDLAERLPDIAMPARTTSPELPLAVGVSPAAEGVAQLEIFRLSAGPTGEAGALRVLYRLGPAGLVRVSSPLEDRRARLRPETEVLMFAGATRLQLRVHAGGFWVDAARDLGVRPFMRATALEIAVEDAGGLRYVKVLAL
jgi:general secretion pathway protein J